MGEWKLWDSTGVVRSELDEAEARSLVDVNSDEGNEGVYCTGPNGERYPEE